MVTLYAKGARAVLVPNTVDVTEIPTINYLPSILRGYLRGKVLQFNIELALALDRIQTTLPQLRLYRVDLRQGKRHLVSCQPVRLHRDRD